MILQELKSDIEKKLMLKSEYINYNGDNVFTNNNGKRFYLYGIQRVDEDDDFNNSVAIEYPDYGDGGDQYYLSDYNDVDEMLEDMLNEIEEETD